MTDHLPLDSVVPGELLQAAKGGIMEDVEDALARGADINEKETFGNTALIYAVQGNHAEVLSLLLQEGADVDRQNKGGDTALMMAAEQEPRPDFARILIARHADLNVANNTSGFTALFKAVIYGTPAHIDIAAMLIKAGADIGAKDKNDRTVFDLAREKGNVEILSLLEEVVVSRVAAATAEKAAARALLDRKHASLKARVPRITLRPGP